MSDKTEKPVNTGAEQPANADVSASQPQEDLKSTVERLLAESKKWKERATKAEPLVKEYESFKQKQLQEQGEYKQLYEKTHEELVTLKQQSAKMAVKTQLVEALKSAGCIDAEAAVQLGPSSLLSYDEATGVLDGKDLFVQEVKKNKQYLFSAAKAPMINPAVPNGVAQEKTLNVNDIAKLPKNEKMKIWLKAMQKS